MPSKQEQSPQDKSRALIAALRVLHWKDKRSVVAKAIQMSRNMGERPTSTPHDTVALGMMLYSLGDLGDTAEVIASEPASKDVRELADLTARFVNEMSEAVAYQLFKEKAG